MTRVMLSTLTDEQLDAIVKDAFEEYIRLAAAAERNGKEPATVDLLSLMNGHLHPRGYSVLVGRAEPDLMTGNTVFTFDIVRSARYKLVYSAAQAEKI